MSNNIKVLDDFRGNEMNEPSRTITLSMRTLEESPLLREHYDSKTRKGFELGFETPRPLVWLGSNYGYHWGCTIRHSVTGENRHDARMKAEQWAKQFVELQYIDVSDLSGPVIESH